MTRGTPGLKRPIGKDNQPMVTPAELAAETGLCVEHIRERCRGGRGQAIPCVKLMNKVFIDRSEALKVIYDVQHRTHKLNTQPKTPSVKIPDWL